MAKASKPEIDPDVPADNYKRITGIGPAVERRLHNAGFSSYAQLADLTPKELAKILDGMVGYSVERIIEKDFIGQAKDLAEEAGQLPAGPADQPKNDSLHYASYAIELLLDAENNVRRTRTRHIQSDKESSWAGWDQEKLKDFLMESGQLHDVSTRPELFQADENTAPHTPQPAKILSKQVLPMALQMTGDARIAEIHLQSIEGKTIGSLIPSGERVIVSLELDLSQVEVPEDERLSYNADIYTKSVGKRKNELIGDQEGPLPPGDRAVIEIDIDPFAPGDYRLEALVALRPQSQLNQLKHQLMAMSEGMLIHVF